MSENEVLGFVEDNILYYESMLDHVEDKKKVQTKLELLKKHRQKILETFKAA